MPASLRYKFDAAVGVVISMNTVTIGAELEYQCRGLPIPSYFQVRSWTVESS